MYVVDEDDSDHPLLSANLLESNKPPTMLCKPKKFCGSRPDMDDAEFIEYLET